MKKIITILLVLTASMSFSQNQPIDFESGGHGANWTWKVFENGTDPALEIIPNPDPTGINTSATVAKFTALQTGQPFAGVESTRGVDLGTFQWNDNNRIVKIMVWKPVISEVGLKFATETGWSEPELKVSNTLINQWEELTFDFSNANNPPHPENGTLGQIIIFPDFNARTQDNIVYFDNITFGPADGTTPADAPTVAAPAPPARNAADVISLFSQTYTNVAVDTWRTDWSAANYEEVTIAGRTTKRYSNLDFVGIETIASQIDISAMTHVHVNVWSPNVTEFRLKLVDFGPDGAFEGGDDTEHQIVFPQIAQGQWVSLNVPLSDFTALTTRNNLAQYIFSGEPIGALTVYVDNFYFYREGGTPPVAETPRNPIDFEVGGFGVDWTWNVFENATNPPLEIIPNPDPAGINTSATVAKFTALQGGATFAGVESMEGDLGSFTWDETNRIVKIMVWKSVISDVGIKFDGGANPNDWSSGEIRVANTLVNQWEELTFDFSNAPNPPAEVGGLKRIAIFPDFNARTQDNVVYFDNITFGPADGTTPADAPTVAAPAPPARDAADVISLFSQTYTNVAVDTWRTGWSEAAYEEVTIAGRATKRYSNLDFVGIETIASQLDISGMTHVHVNVWSPNVTLFRLKLVDFGPDGAFQGGDDTEHEIVFPQIAQRQWVSLNIPLSEFTALTTRNNLAQYIFSGEPTGALTVYIDNFYFYRDLTNTVAEESNTDVRVYPNPVRMGDQLRLSSVADRIDVMDVTGRLVVSVRETATLETDGLTRGVFFLRIQTKEGDIQVRKIAVQ